MSDDVRVSDRGAARWERGHPWIFASDVRREDGPARIVTVATTAGRPLGQALYSPASEIRLRLLDRRVDPPIDRAWWRSRLADAAERRVGLDATGFRVVHGEGDGLPSLVVDRYDRWIVAQLLSAGLEAVRDEVVDALEEVLRPDGILLRNDAAVRRRERLPLAIEVVRGTVPDEIEIREGAVRYRASPAAGRRPAPFWTSGRPGSGPAS